MPGFLGGNKAAAGGVPPGMNLKNALIQAAPLFASMAAGYSSGRGPYAYMDQGIASIQANQKAKRDEEAAAAAAAAFGNLRPGGMGAAGGGGGGGGTPFVYEPSKPMPKADLGGISGMGEAGIGFAGLPKADIGMLGATDGLGFTVPGSGDPTLGLIKSFEGFQETPYWDVNALRTGYGSDTVTLPDGTVQKVGEGTRVSQEDADRDLQRRVSTEFAPIAARAVGEDVFASLLPNQKAALTSITYNYGELPSSVAEAVRSGDPQAAAAAIAALGSHNNGINAGRRSKEAAFYLSGSTGGGTAPDAPAGPVDPMSDPYVQQLMTVMSMPGITPEQQAVIQMQLESRIGMLTAPQPGAEEEATRAMRARDADLLGYTRGSPEWNQYVVTGEMPKSASPLEVGGVLLDPTGQNVLFDSRVPPAPEAPTTKTVKLADGSDVMVQWNPETQVWDAAPIPEGGTTGAGKKLTEAQSKLTLFQTLQTETAPVLNELEKQFDPSNLGDPSLAKIPIAGNYFTSTEYQMYTTAASAWAEGALRISTGAAATQPEIERTIKTYFAQPGDTPETVAFKASMRAMYDRAVNNALGQDNGGGKLMLPSEFSAAVAGQGAPDATGNSTSTGIPTFNPATGEWE